MSLHLYVAGNDYTDHVEMGSMHVQESARSASPGSLSVSIIGLTSHFASVYPRVGDEIAWADAAAPYTDYFRGFIVKITRNHYDHPGSLRMTVDATDMSYLLSLNVVAGTTIHPTTSDAAAINWLLDTYGTHGIDGDYVTNTGVAIPAFDWEGHTLAEAIAEVCELTGSDYYVDFGRHLHVFTVDDGSEGDELSDTWQSTGGYPWVDLELHSDVTAIKNAFYGIPGLFGDGVPTWYTDATSIAAYGRCEDSFTIDSNRQAELDATGYGYLALHKNPIRSGWVTTYRGGYRPGMLVTVKTSDLANGGDTPYQDYRIASVTTTYQGRANTPLYRLELADPSRPTSLAAILGGAKWNSRKAARTARENASRWRFVRIARETLRASFNPTTTADYTETATSIPADKAVAVQLTVGIRQSSGNNVAINVQDYSGDAAATVYTSGVAGRGGFAHAGPVLVGGTNRRQFKWSVSAYTGVDVWIYCDGFWVFEHDRP